MSRALYVWEGGATDAMDVLRYPRASRKDILGHPHVRKELEGMLTEMTVRKIAYDISRIPNMPKPVMEVIYAIFKEVLGSTREDGDGDNP